MDAEMTVFDNTGQWVSRSFGRAETLRNHARKIVSGKYAGWRCVLCLENGLVETITDPTDR